MPDTNSELAAKQSELIRLIRAHRPGNNKGLESVYDFTRQCVGQYGNRFLKLDGHARAADIQHSHKDMFRYAFHDGAAVGAIMSGAVDAMAHNAAMRRELLQGYAQGVIKDFIREGRTDDVFALTDRLKIVAPDDWQYCLTPDARFFAAPLAHDMVRQYRHDLPTLQRLFTLVENAFAGTKNGFSDWLSHPEKKDYLQQHETGDGTVAQYQSYLLNSALVANVSPDVFNFLSDTVKQYNPGHFNASIQTANAKYTGFNRVKGNIVSQNNSFFHLGARYGTAGLLHAIETLYLRELGAEAGAERITRLLHQKNTLKMTAFDEIDHRVAHDVNAMKQEKHEGWMKQVQDTGLAVKAWMNEAAKNYPAPAYVVERPVEPPAKPKAAPVAKPQPSAAAVMPAQPAAEPISKDMVLAAQEEAGEETAFGSAFSRALEAGSTRPDRVQKDRGAKRGRAA